MSSQSLPILRAIWAFPMHMSNFVLLVPAGPVLFCPLPSHFPSSWMTEYLPSAFLDSGASCYFIDACLGKYYQILLQSQQYAVVVKLLYKTTLYVLFLNGEGIQMGFLQMGFSCPMIHIFYQSELSLPQILKYFVKFLINSNHMFMRAEILITVKIIGKEAEETEGRTVDNAYNMICNSQHISNFPTC